MIFRNLRRCYDGKKNFIRLLSDAAKKRVRDHHLLKFLPQEELAPLMSYLPKFIEDAISQDILLGVTKLEKRFERLLKHNLPTGKLLRLHTLIYVFKAIEDHYGNGALGQEKLEKLYQMCWCLEVHNTTIILVDDMMDSNDTRRGDKTWTALVGGGAANDTLLVEYILLKLLKKYFKVHPNYANIVDVFLEPHCPIAMALELETTNLEEFNSETVKLIAALKMMHHNYSHPIVVATLLADKAHFMNDLIRKPLMHMGYLYSIQNDIADCYGNDFTGKSCVDIQDKRCGFPIVTALHKANSTQKKILEENFGHKDETKVKKVLEVYEELDILGEYYKVEEKYLKKLSQDIESIPDDFTRDLMWKLAYVNSFGEIGVPPF